jgi:hypothetical protein
MGGCCSAQSAVAPLRGAESDMEPAGLEPEQLLALPRGARCRAALAGLPDAARRAVWLRASGGAALRRRCPGAFAALAATQTDSDKQIALDVPRTFGRLPPALRARCDEAALASVLRATAAALPSVGYVQGMNVLASTCLAAGLEAEEAFFVLAAMLWRLRLNELFAEGLRALAAALDAVGARLAAAAPELAARLAALGAEPALFATPWLLCLFAHNLRADAAMVLWDLLLLRCAHRDGDGDAAAEPARAVQPQLPGAADKTVREGGDRDADGDGDTAAPLQLDALARVAPGATTELLANVCVALVRARESQLRAASDLGAVARALGELDWTARELAALLGAERWLFSEEDAREGEGDGDGDGEGG